MLYKFLNSKKGFTLVELLAVVVILSILVAVAVPIFSAVTKNAQKKTCDANKREIVSQLTNYCIGNNNMDDIFNEDDDFVITFDGATGDITSPGNKITKEDVEAMFQDVPYCPVENSEYVVTLTKGTGSPTIDVECSIHD